MSVPGQLSVSYQHPTTMVLHTYILQLELRHSPTQPTPISLLVTLNNKPTAHRGTTCIAAG
jgi:hypothetical protein